MAEGRCRSEVFLRPRPGLGRWLRRQARSEAVPWTGVTGLLALALTALLFISGAVMTLYYSPTPGIAYDSVDHAQFDLPFGVLVRGVHVYAWNLLLVVLALHFGLAFIMGAYKPPWDRVWISGILALLVVPGFIVTGDLLPWNQSGYWSTQVRLGIMSSVPLVGEFLSRLLQGGPHIGIVTLTRFYTLHILFLPCALIGLLALHVFFIRQALRSRPVADGSGREEAQSPRLNLVNRWALVLLVAIVVLGLVSWERPAPLGDPADPTDTSYIPRPEWWVLPLNQLVTIFTGHLMVLATVIIPGGLVGLLLALPFLDRSPERHPARRRKAMLAAAGVGAVMLGLAAMSYIEHYAPQGDRGGGLGQHGKLPAAAGK